LGIVALLPAGVITDRDEQAVSTTTAMTQASRDITAA
jgi:hypothetical protein